MREILFHAFFHDNDGSHVIAVDLLSANNLKIDLLSPIWSDFVIRVTLNLTSTKCHTCMQVG